MGFRIVPLLERMNLNSMTMLNNIRFVDNLRIE